MSPERMNQTELGRNSLSLPTPTLLRVRLRPVIGVGSRVLGETLGKPRLGRSLRPTRASHCRLRQVREIFFSQIGNDRVFPSLTLESLNDPDDPEDYATKPDNEP